VRAVEEACANSDHVLGRYARLHDEELANSLVPVVDALVVACVSRARPSKHLLKNDIPRLHHAAVIAHACSGFVGSAAIVGVALAAAAHAKHSMAQSRCRVRPNKVELRKSAVNVRLLHRRISDLLDTAWKITLVLSEKTMKK
jgi:hypothetical protein